MVIGSTISHYKILEKLGEGGMGIVYKAHDTTLDRAVALKFLADHLLNNTEAKERFLREAKAAAALHHPNVCPVHEIGEADGKTFLAMAFLKGETLEDRIAQGPLPIKDALDIARQVSEGLQAAHAEGIVHRDIKPANILVSPEGRPTIMDFGLARLTEASRLTKVDTAMGTVAYMSPEQAQGIEVDSRSDIWSLGCVLYEMVSARRPFNGEYDQAVLYEIVHQDPEELTSLRAGVPMELEFSVGKCLAKNAEDRYQTAKEVAVDLRTLAEKFKPGGSKIWRTRPASAPTSSRRALSSASRVWQALFGAAVLVALGLAYAYFTVPEAKRPVRRFSLAPSGYTEESASISPDGKLILYRAGPPPGSLWVRSLENETPRELPGTAGVLGTGFWSPDSQSVGFATESPNFELKRVSIEAGEAVTLTRLPRTAGAFPFSGGTWSPDGERIVFSSGLRLFALSARGGEPELLFDPSGEARPFASFPAFLAASAGAQRLVYQAASTPSDVAIAVMDLDNGERRELAPGSRPVYSPRGYLIHGPASANQAGLRASPFSVDDLELTGSSFSIHGTGRAASVAQDGTLVYTDNPFGNNRQIVVRDRTGAVLQAVGDPVNYPETPALSPDGRRLAIAVDGDIWVYDLDRDVRTRLTRTASAEIAPTWLNAMRDVAYLEASDASSQFNTRVVARIADGSMEPRVLFESLRGLSAMDWSLNERYLAFNGGVGDSEDEQGGIWYRERRADGSFSEAVPYLLTPVNENTPVFSPDGRYIAYAGTESGQFEIYVRPFPMAPGKWQVSSEGGRQPRWSADGSELFYVEESTDTLVAVPISRRPVFAMGDPERLFAAEDLRPLRTQSRWRYDVFPDGQRFVLFGPSGGEDGGAPATTVRIVENWFEEFRDRER